MTFVTPLYNEETQQDKIAAVQDRLQFLNNFDEIKTFAKHEHQSSVWFTGVYKDTHPASPHERILERDSVDRLAWCADEGDYGDFSYL